MASGRGADLRATDECHVRDEEESGVTPDESLLELAHQLRIEGYVMAVMAFVGGLGLGGFAMWVVLR